MVASQSIDVLEMKNSISMIATSVGNYKIAKLHTEEMGQHNLYGISALSLALEQTNDKELSNEEMKIINMLCKCKDERIMKGNLTVLTHNLRSILFH